MDNLNSSSMVTINPYVDLVRKKFPKFISIEKTNGNAFADGLLFRKEHYNDYCFIEHHKSTDTIVFSIFKSAWKAFEKIEGDFLDHSVSFNFRDETQAITLMNILV
jgi:hypothetical protein